MREALEMKARDTETPILPKLEQMERARALFEEYEPRDLFYLAATELVRFALDGKTSLKVAEALAILLQTWNAQYYRFGHHSFDSAHFDAIEAVISLYLDSLKAYRSRHLLLLETDEVDELSKLFEDFESVLGPVGAAKALHLLAPEFFPLWDRKIARSYGIRLGNAGENGSEYVRFMTIVFEQITNVVDEADIRGILKRIDEFNYCRFTKGWL
jgi:hypothetical protein